MLRNGIISTFCNSQSTVAWKVFIIPRIFDKDAYSVFLCPRHSKNGGMVL